MRNKRNKLKKGVRKKLIKYLFRLFRLFRTPTRKMMTTSTSRCFVCEE